VTHGRCTGLGKAWRQASNAPDIWAKVMEGTQPELAAAVLPLARRHLPPGGGEGVGGQLTSWHPKRLLKQHWRMARDGRPDDDSSEEAEEDNSWAARQRKEERRWQARFRDCYLQFTVNDGEKPNAAPLLTKFLPISDSEALTGFPLAGALVITPFAWAPCSSPTRTMLRRIRRPRGRRKRRRCLWV